jgi:hypothetical protein
MGEKLFFNIFSEAAASKKAAAAAVVEVKKINSN